MLHMLDTNALDRLSDETKAKELNGETEPKYTVAAETELFQGDDKESLQGRYKSITNKANESQIFAIVGDGYKVIQHDEVVDMINDSLSELNMKAESNIFEMKGGGRIHGEMIFKEHYLDVKNDGEIVNMRLFFDNSYDCSTGVRMRFGAFLPRRNAFLYVEENMFGRFYHKHTQGLNKHEMGKDIEKGGKICQEKLSAMFRGMASTPVNFAHVKTLLEEKIGKKYIPDKYLVAVNDAVKSGVGTMWDLFIVYSEVMSVQTDSVDVRSEYSLKFLSMFTKAVNENRI